jgi:hypothetical protein
MTLNAQDNQNLVTEQKTNDKEYNFAQLRKQAEAERLARIQAEERAAQLERQIKTKPSAEDDEDDEDSEPYVDRRKLKKELSRFGEHTKQQTQVEIQKAVQQALDEERRSNYLKNNSDFNQVMSGDVIQKFADRHPDLAENILKMPDGFERQKLVYTTIKALGVDKPDAKPQSIQEKIEANRKNPYYQPSQMGTAPYGTHQVSGRNVSPQEGQKLYEQMKQLKENLRLG